MSEDYYAVLGVARDASDLEVKQAFRGLASRWHPDRHPEDEGATERFQTLVRAWEILGHRDRRSAYDAGQAVVEGPRIEAGTALQELFGGLVDGLFGVRDRRPRPGRDRRYELRLGLREVARGTRRELSLPHEEPCSACEGRGFPLSSLPHVCARCGGSGEVQRRPTLRSTLEACEDCDGRGFRFTEACGVCKGTGEQTVRRKVDVVVPVGVVDGQELRMRGAGEPGSHGGEPGDLWIRVSVEPHPVLRRQGDDVLLRRPVPLLRALLGGWIEVPTVDGGRRVRLPAGVADGEVLRMEGLGIERPDGRRGDQLVTLSLEAPHAVDGSLREGLESALAAAAEGTFPRSERFEAEHTPRESLRQEEETP